MLSKSVFVPILASITLFATISAAQSGLVPTSKAVAGTIYPWITFMTQGPAEYAPTSSVRDADEGEDTSYSYRVLITTSEIYNSIYFEKIQLGSEGCCAKVLWTRALDMNKFDSVVQGKGERSGLQFIKWLSPTSFQFSLHENVFNVIDISKKTVKIVSD